MRNVGRTTLLMLAPASLFLLAAPFVPQAAPRGAPGSFAAQVQPFLKSYCIACHSGAQPAGGLNFTHFRSVPSVVNARAEWEKVIQYLQIRHMPPPGSAQPTDAERTALITWIQTTLANANCVVSDPGHVTLRRLNRAEYNNSVESLLGVDLRPADNFPSDDVGYGFDNIGDVLSISPLLMEDYMRAARQLAQAAINAPDATQASSQIAPGEFSGGGAALVDSGIELDTNGTATAKHNFRIGGRYRITVTAYGEQAGPAPAHMAVSLDGAPIGDVDVTAVAAAPASYTFQAAVTPGQHTIGAAFTNDYYNPNDPNPANRDRNLIICSASISPPLAGSFHLPHINMELASYRKAGLAPAVIARKILSPLAAHAWRRPVTAAEAARLVHYVALAQSHGESFERGLQLGLEAILVSPNFLYHVEITPPSQTGGLQKLTDYEIAARLSYFIWSDLPDAELTALAAAGKLHQPAVLAEQVHRMLLDPRARELGSNFAAQWLELRNLNTVRPDPARFPEYGTGLRDDERTETEMFFNDIVHNDRSVLNFLNADYSFLNNRLARFYGLSGVHGADFRRVQLADDRRGGLVTMASVLTVTSDPTRTSPVQRGKWVLDNILGTPPPPPPAVVPRLPDDTSGTVKGTLRQRMEIHRKNPACASCHKLMDPIGFGLENFDAVGRWRTQDDHLPVDASGTLPGGQRFDGPAELKAILLARKAMFVHCLTTKLFTYALGRGPTAADACGIDAISKQAEAANYRFSAIVT
ncbi:MAG: DUF1592 domain-containing protein, partial [Armatimonadetes bacterium]|nr:DUF1592 domain-containing protein [Armatimonadota bacterium]